jgi:hypothetical protein
MSLTNIKVLFTPLMINIAALQIAEISDVLGAISLCFTCLYTFLKIKKEFYKPKNKNKNEDN